MDNTKKTKNSILALVISIIATLVAIFALYYARQGTIMTKKSLEISQLGHSENSENIMNGEWEMTVFVDGAKNPDFVSSKIVWIIDITQIGMILTGGGETTQVNNKQVDFNNRPTMDFVTGSFKDNKFTITYIQSGNGRNTYGQLNGTLDEDSFEGRFSQRASETKGRITGKRIIH